MESRRKRSRSQILKWCCYVLGLFVCAALQTTPGLFQLGQAKPLLLLPLCLAVSVCEGEFAGALFGMVCGLLWDYTAGRTVGMLALEMMLLCFAVGVLVQLYLQSAPGNFAVISAAPATAARHSATCGSCCLRRPLPFRRRWWSLPSCGTFTTSSRSTTAWSDRRRNYG